ncbi:hypothetical protein GCM10009641_19980 [Mycobacterium cookii]|uniref:Uncharacterized protein n=1 Tax=Mycobacterium cookii TaxID=1775 RepID=A0A7I7KVR0_9MYCO|nr:hypothetical protein [Mycobacterium cookii]MCV7328785.1 hypothetical protein [Mycobacterium cookii]BBX45412.1 hypothetical protein MCOO_14270 [Mycobacterium cookii]
MQSIPPPQNIFHKNRLLFAGFSAIGVGLLALNPGTGMSNVEHRTVRLVAGEETWSQVVAAAEANVQTLEANATASSSDLSSAFSALSTEFGGQFSSALTGVESGIQNSLDGGWYGSDDGYVFGLFGGSVSGPDGIETGSTLQEISAALEQGNLLNAFSYFDAWSLESVDHTLKPLLSPLLDETSKGATTLSIPVELSQIQTNLLETFGNYNELKALGDALLAPQIGVAFGLSQDVQGIAADFSAGDFSQALTDLNNLPSDLTGDLLNGYPLAVSGETFTGLLNTGSVLEELFVTWPEQLATALSESFSF